MQERGKQENVGAGQLPDHIRAGPAAGKHYVLLASCQDETRKHAFLDNQEYDQGGKVCSTPS